MTMNIFKSFRNTLRKFRDDRKGVSAVEFAMILPVFALLYFGSIEVSFLMLVDRKVTHTASSLGDLVARGTTMTTAELEDIFDVSQALFSPYDGTTAEMRVTSIMSVDGNTEVVWSRAQNMSAYATGASVSIPDGLISDGQSVIMAEVSFDYNSTLGYFLPSTRTMDEVFYLRPRRVDVVNMQ